MTLFSIDTTLCYSYLFACLLCLSTLLSRSRSLYLSFAVLLLNVVCFPTTLQLSFGDRFAALPMYMCSFVVESKCTIASRGVRRY